MGAIRYAAPPYFTDVMFHYCVADAPSGLYAVRIGSGCNSVQRRGSARFLGRTKADLDLRAWLHHRVSHAGREQYGIHCVKVHHHCIRAQNSANADTTNSASCPSFKSKKRTQNA